MKSTYERVAEWNEKAGKIPHEAGTEAYWQALENQLERIQEELDETRIAIANRDIVEVLDGGCDMDVTVSGFNFLTDLPYSPAITMVLDNNDVKITEDIVLAFRTQKTLEHDTGEPHAVVTVTIGETDWYSVHRVADDKICKLLDHPRVDLSTLVGV